MAGRYSHQIRQARQIFEEQRADDYTSPLQYDDHTQQSERSGLSMADLTIGVSKSNKKKKTAQKVLTPQQIEEQYQKKLEKLRIKEEKKKRKKEKKKNLPLPTRQEPRP